MALIDIALAALLPTLVIFHLYIAPYTKIEESFALEATHDILHYGLHWPNNASSLASTYDHLVYPGPVPRSFVGPVALAAMCKPVLSLVGSQHGQFVTRAVLGLANAAALVYFAQRLKDAYGRHVGRWFVLLQAAQFHVVFYASRTLPNSFGFGGTIAAMSCFLSARNARTSTRRQRLGIYIMVAMAIIFRAEIAVLLGAQLLYMLLQPSISLQNVVSAGGKGVLFALLSIPLDSYFYQQLTWPEFQSFIFNAIRGNASSWGKSPWHEYFVFALPRLLLNPMILFVLVPLSLYLPATRRAARGLLVPAMGFIALYSFLPHKEPRFIIYTVPLFTAAGASAAAYIWDRRMKGVVYAVMTMMLLLSLMASFGASLFMLFVSSLNYPGGQALSHLHTIIQDDLLIHLEADHGQWKQLSDNTTTLEIGVHIDVLSLMTGVTQFQANANTIRVPAHPSTQPDPPPTHAIHLRYDKTEREDWQTIPSFWSHFDYALMEPQQPQQQQRPTHPPLPDWDIVGTIWSYAGIGIMRPGQALSREATAWTQPYQARGDEGDEVVLESSRREILLTQAMRFVRAVTLGWCPHPRMKPAIQILRRRRRWRQQRGADSVSQGHAKSGKEERASPYDRTAITATAAAAAASDDDDGERRLFDALGSTEAISRAKSMQDSLGPVRGRWRPGGRGWRVL